MYYVPYDPSLFEAFACKTLEEAQEQARKIIASGEMHDVLIIRVDNIEGVMEKVSPVWNPGARK